MKEISSVVVQMKLFNLSPSLVIAYRHFIQLLRISPVFKDVFHDVGLIELSIDLLNYLIDTMETFCSPSTTPSTSCTFPFTRSIFFKFLILYLYLLVLDIFINKILYPFDLIMFSVNNR
ncbi:hypothetical protein Smp_190070 [Schistosoma mansoni]|uniref:hypothetical protein n=1 Tax=Schistosoma mansoni TaxID=6183 RepID=UPI00022DCABE|nr:hypothetical protein Smp_190070 [Schistosoma mansoni]|eukprot:XP_018654970.1 hypothetical protein Smp_190070 [Schistosoma mansoni]